ncbi:hypothetical protein MA9V1_257 [Chryseobacterium phage MA9V-1]|nr:hypothetical protein MA9V1_257 [Chryseobacterium phage MA9V-1]
MKLLIIGHAQHGKDTVADIMAAKLGLSATSSSITAINHWIFKNHGERLGFSSPEDMYERRGEMRKFLFDEIVAFCSPNLAALAEVLFEKHDIYVGCRNADEVKEIQNKGLVDLIIYVDASERKPMESKESCNITKDLADIIIDNNGSLAELRFRLASLCYLLRYNS